MHDLDELPVDLQFRVIDEGGPVLVRDDATRVRHEVGRDRFLAERGEQHRIQLPPATGDPGLHRAGRPPWPKRVWEILTGSLQDVDAFLGVVARGAEQA